MKVGRSPQLKNDTDSDGRPKIDNPKRVEDRQPYLKIPVQLHLPVIKTIS